MNEEELLLHYGVKGMKWGVRRARNRVGSVTRKFKDAHDKADASKNARRTASQQRQNNSKFGQAHLKANAKKDARREKQNANLAEHKRLEKERADKAVSKVKDYAKVAGTTYKDSMKNPIASDKAARQLMKEKPKTALYRNKDDLKRLNQLTAENVAAKKAKREASKSYKEAKKLDNAAKNAKRKETASKIGRELLAISNDVMQDKKMVDAMVKINSSLDKGMTDIVRNAVYEETQKRKSDYRTAIGR